MLDQIVKTKNAKASSWDWRSVDERWLRIAAEATTLATTMVLLGRPEPLGSAGAFTRVLAWDGFCERIHQLLPTFGTIFEMRREGPMLHRSMMPSSIVKFVDANSQTPP